MKPNSVKFAYVMKFLNIRYLLLYASVLCHVLCHVLPVLCHATLLDVPLALLHKTKNG